MGTTEYFLKKGIVKDAKERKALDFFSEAVPDFESTKLGNASDYIFEGWRAYEGLPSRSNSLNGKVFEYLVISLLIKLGISPLYIEAKAAFVPNVKFDLLLYTQKGPIVLSLKTSLRERYKQADLEAIALKYVHRNSQSFLITLNEGEANSVNGKIASGDVIGINEVVLAQSDAMDRLCKMLKARNFVKAGSVEIIEAQCVVEL